MMNYQFESDDGMFFVQAENDDEAWDILIRENIPLRNLHYFGTYDDETAEAMGYDTF